MAVGCTFTVFAFEPDDDIFPSHFFHQLFFTESNKHFFSEELKFWSGILTQGIMDHFVKMHQEEGMSWIDLEGVYVESVVYVRLLASQIVQCGQNEKPQIVGSMSDFESLLKETDDWVVRINCSFVPFLISVQ